MAGKVTKLCRAPKSLILCAVEAHDLRRKHTRFRPQDKFSSREATGSNGVTAAHHSPTRGVTANAHRVLASVIRTFILHSFNKPSTNFQLVCAITAGERSDNLGCLRFFPKLRASCIYF